MTRAVKRAVAGWGGWDWTALVVTSAAFALLIVTVAVGRSWPGSELVLVLSLLGGGPGVATLLGLLDRQGTDEDEGAEQ